MIDVVNFYLNEMTEAILAAGGTLIAYMGDGIMAVFGAPLEQDDHADRALARGARDDRTAPASASTRGCASRAHDDGFRMGVGLNSGPVMAGNVGSERAGGVHGDRRHDEHRLAPRGHDEGHAAHAVHLGHHARSPRRAAATTWSSSTISRCAGAQKIAVVARSTGGGARHRPRRPTTQTPNTHPAPAADPAPAAPA